MTRCRSGAAVWLAALVAMFSTVAAPSRAQDDGSQPQVVNGIEVYLGIVPAGLVRDHPRGHTESKMHGGPAAGGYHVLVALFDRTTGQRITDARVSAQLVSESHPAPETRLEPMTVAGAQTYGNYFDMVRGGSYRLDVLIRRPGAPVAVATFRPVVR